MPKTRSFHVRGAKVKVEVNRGREYDRRLELRCDDIELLYGVDSEAGRIVADFLGLYEDGDLEAIGENAEQPAWADTVLGELDITEVRA